MLGNAVLSDTTKEQFLAHVAREYDEAVEDGNPPDSIVFSLGKLRGSSYTNWLCVGDAEGAASAILGRAIADITVRYGRTSRRSN